MIDLADMIDLLEAGDADTEKRRSGKGSSTNPRSGNGKNGDLIHLPDLPRRPVPVRNPATGQERISREKHQISVSPHHGQTLPVLAGKSQDHRTKSFLMRRYKSRPLKFHRSTSILLSSFSLHLLQLSVPSSSSNGMPGANLNMTQRKIHPNSIRKQKTFLSLSVLPWRLCKRTMA